LQPVIELKLELPHTGVDSAELAGQAGSWIMFIGFVVLGVGIIIGLILSVIGWIESRR
jgi:hypothetical protein